MTRDSNASWIWIPAGALAVAALGPAMVGAQGGRGWNEPAVVRVERGEWSGPRLPDGQPDIAGFYSNTRGNHNNLTGGPGPGNDEDLEAAPSGPASSGGFAPGVTELPGGARPAPQGFGRGGGGRGGGRGGRGGGEGAPAAGGGREGAGPPQGRGQGVGRGGGDQAAGRGAGRGGGGRGGAALSRISDPADGRFPSQPWAREKAEEFRRFLNNPVKPEYVEPFARCAPGGPTKSFMWHGYEIRQYPGYVLFLFDSGNRIIHLNNQAHVPENIKLWNGDSRGRWEGNTLVVDTTNNNSKWRFGRTGEFVTENATVKETFTFAGDGSRFIYDATWTDPASLTRSFTISIPNKRVYADTPVDDWNNQTFLANHDGPDEIIEAYERICIEGNGTHGRPVAQN